MKKIIMSVAITLFCAATALAADVITLPAKNGNVKFTHQKHQKLLKDCKLCHAKGPGKIAGFGKDAAHKLCIDCHKAKKAGPVKCGDCHKK
ncbi:MAG: cytochrome C [Deltaproteobacteria bacterium]|nr:cytochrome C [Deltaproteobacteria bacterium]